VSARIRSVAAVSAKTRSDDCIEAEMLSAWAARSPESRRVMPISHRWLICCSVLSISAQASSQLPPAWSWLVRRSRTVAIRSRIEVARRFSVGVGSWGWRPKASCNCASERCSSVSIDSRLVVARNRSRPDFWCSSFRNNHNMRSNDSPRKRSAVSPGSLASMLRRNSSSAAQRSRSFSKRWRSSGVRNERSWSSWRRPSAAGGGGCFPALSTAWNRGLRPRNPRYASSSPPTIASPPSASGPLIKARAVPAPRPSRFQCHLPARTKFATIPSSFFMGLRPPFHRR